MKEILPGVMQRKSQVAGPTVAIFAGVHGNESVGILALREALRRVKIKRGTLYAIFANPLAIEQNVRLVNKNLNRCFFKNNTGSTYEDHRARDLMKVLDKCQALLDLHAFNDKTGEAFTICEESALEVALKLEPSLISTNWTRVEPGATDGYMHQEGKIGLCVECGPVAQWKASLPLASKVIDQFLKFFEIIDTEVEFSNSTKRIIKVKSVRIRESEDFHLDPALKSFQKLAGGQVIGSQNGEQFRAAAGDYIIFPRPSAQVGAEAFIIGSAQ